MQRLVPKCLFSLVVAAFLIEIGHGQPTYQQYAEKLGKESRIWIAEPGDTGLNRWDPRELFEDSGILLDWDSKRILLFRSTGKTETTLPATRSYGSNPRGPMNPEKKSIACSPTANSNRSSPKDKKLSINSKKAGCPFGNADLSWPK